MIADSRIWAVVPVKRFSAAKTRLASVLDAAERAELARLMFEDVRDALMQCRDILAGTLVVTSDAEAAALARCHGAAVVPDTPDCGINDAIRWAVRSIHTKADDALMVVPADIPQVTPNAFAQAASAIATKPRLAIAVAADDRGTNLFACRPVEAIAPCFGPLSFDQHRRAALQAGVAVRTLCLPELSLDIDRPENLRTFLTLKSSTRTHAFLARIRRIEDYQNFARQPLDRAAAEV